jgi:Protein of unknown function DUF72.
LTKPRQHSGSQSKANRYLTHNKKLLDPKASILIEKNHAEALGEKLAVVLWQLPGLLKKEFGPAARLYRRLATMA